MAQTKQTQKTVQVQKVDVQKARKIVELVEKLVVPRYRIAVGIRVIEKTMKNDPKVVQVASEKEKIRAEMKEIERKWKEGKEITKEERRRYIELSKKYSELREKWSEVTSPYKEKIKPLRKKQRELDQYIVGWLEKLGYPIKDSPITDVEQLPIHLQPNPSQ